MSKAYRPSHADATYDMKYGVRAIQVVSFGIEMCCMASPDPSSILPLFKIITGLMGSMHGTHRSMVILKSGRMGEGLGKKMKHLPFAFWKFKFYWAKYILVHFIIEGWR
jgi:hypothetical protein